jgi:hypothetical protein
MGSRINFIILNADFTDLLAVKIQNILKVCLYGNCEYPLILSGFYSGLS